MVTGTDSSPTWAPALGTPQLGMLQGGEDGILDHDRVSLWREEDGSADGRRVPQPDAALVLIVPLTPAGKNPPAVTAAALR